MATLLEVEQVEEMLPQVVVAMACLVVVVEVEPLVREVQEVLAL
jgi:hypothetical protein